MTVARLAFGRTERDAWAAVEGMCCCLMQVLFALGPVEDGRLIAGKPSELANEFEIVSQERNSRRQFSQIQAISPLLMSTSEVSSRAVSAP